MTVDRQRGTLAISRRDFLKLASLFFLVWYGQKKVSLDKNLRHFESRVQDANVIIIVLDAFSARHISLYGYRRNTTPNLDRFAQCATVYHRHYSGGNYTTPGTASLLTGVYPWTHRATYPMAEVNKVFGDRNLFNLMASSHSQLGFSQNPLADIFLTQFESALDRHFPADTFNLFRGIFYTHNLFSADAMMAFRSLDYFLFDGLNPSGSLVFSTLHKINSMLHKESIQKLWDQDYPRGIPDAFVDNAYFVLEDLFRGVEEMLLDVPSPKLAYFHLMPPHEPYHPGKQYVGLFDDGWEAPAKELHRLSKKRYPQEYLNQERQAYDEFIAHTDAELGRLFTFFEQSGLLENSYIVITSDHGEMFERGEKGHVTPLLYESIIHIPLLISRPGQLNREDVYIPTSCTDVLPTLLHVTGKPVPEWCQGRLLPGFGGIEDTGRSIFVMDARLNSVYAPWHIASIAMIKDPYKLIYYLGYPQYDNVYELYDLQDDPEELHDIYASERAIASALQDELQTEMRSANESYLDQSKRED